MSSSEPTTLRDLFDRVEQHRTVITVFAPDVPVELRRTFGSRHVELRHEYLPSRVAEPYLTVTRDGEYLGSVSLAAVYNFRTRRPANPGVRNRHTAEYRKLFALLDDTLFSSLDRRNLLATSREIEDRAWRTERGTLYAGFQNLSAFRTQFEVYEDVARHDVQIHVYGRIDWDPPTVSGVTIHTEGPDLGAFWFVAFDGGGDDVQKCGLLAEERTPGEFAGFWTYDPALVDDLVATVRSNYGPGRRDVEQSVDGDDHTENETP